MTSYPHMCRDGHTEIGHSDSESEMCPLCKAIASLAQLHAAQEKLKEALQDIIDEENGANEMRKTAKAAPLPPALTKA